MNNVSKALTGVFEPTNLVVAAQAAKAIESKDVQELRRITDGSYQCVVSDYGHWDFRAIAGLLIGRYQVFNENKQFKDE